MAPFTIALVTILLTLLGLYLRRRKPGPRLPPGPRPLPIIGNLHMLRKQPHRVLAELARKHGPIMSLRLGQVPAVVASSPRAAELFLKQHDAVCASRPPIEAAVHFSHGCKGVVFTPYGDYWRSARKVFILHLLSVAKIEGFQQLRRRETEALVRRLREEGERGEAVNVGERVGDLIEEITFKMVVGKGKDDDDNGYRIRPVVEEALALAGAFNLADFLPFLAAFDIQGLTREMKAKSKATDKMFDKIIDDHLKEEDFGQSRDILGAILALMNNPGVEFPPSFGRDNIKAILLDLFAGGMHTLNATVTWAISALLKHPRVMKCLRDELDAVAGGERMVDESDLPRLSYLDMVLKETFRLYPVAPLLVPHESTEDFSIDGYTIPKKSRLIINSFAIGRDPSVWSENAEDFFPERFANCDIDFQGRDFKLIPFGAGRRGCPGRNLGLVSVKLVLAQLVYCFDWKLANGLKPEDIDMTEDFGGLSMPKATKLLAIPSYRLKV